MPKGKSEEGGGAPDSRHIKEKCLQWSRKYLLNELSYLVAPVVDPKNTKKMGC